MSNFKEFDHFDIPIRSAPLTEDELQMMRAIIAAEKQKQAHSAKKVPNSKLS